MLEALLKNISRTNDLERRAANTCTTICNLLIEHCCYKKPDKEYYQCYRKVTQTLIIELNNKADFLHGRIFQTKNHQILQQLESIDEKIKIIFAITEYQKETEDDNNMDIVIPNDGYEYTPLYEIRT